MPIVLLIFALICPPSKIEWLTPTEYDFGSIPQGKPVKTVFTFKNKTDLPVVIDNVRTECGCTEAERAETPIPAGATGQIPVQYDAQKKGFFKKKIIVWLHGQRFSEPLYITGVVE
jgi:Protein of unknown function (DUF1573)